jgi:hypothetical protein
MESIMETFYSFVIVAGMIVVAAFIGWLVVRAVDKRLEQRKAKKHVVLSKRDVAFNELCGKLVDDCDNVYIKGNTLYAESKRGTIEISATPELDRVTIHCTVDNKDVWLWADKYTEKRRVCGDMSECAIEQFFSALGIDFDKQFC